MRKDLLTEDQVLSRWDGLVTKIALRNWRYRGKGPAYVKLGRFVYYKQDDIEAFERQTHRQTNVSGGANV